MAKSKEKRKESSLGAFIIMLAITVVIDVITFFVSPEAFIQVAGTSIGLATVFSLIGFVYCVYCVQEQAEYEMKSATTRLEGPDTTPGGQRRFTCSECGGIGYYEIDDANIINHVVCRYCGKPFTPHG